MIALAPHAVAPTRSLTALSAALLCLALCGACAARPPLPAHASAPKYAAHALPLARSHDYFRSAPAHDFWALAPYYVPQHNDRACSLASLSMIVNAARRELPLGSEEPLVTQAALQAAVNSPVWRKGLAEGGEGVTLDELGALAELSLRAFGLQAERVDVVHIPEASNAALGAWRELLARNEAGKDDFLLLNFLTSAVTGAGDYGHIAPVGAYDAAQRRVLILDPDRTWYEPYWVPDHVALQAMATRDDVSKQHRGYVYVSGVSSIAKR